MAATQRGERRKALQEKGVCLAATGGTWPCSSQEQASARGGRPLIGQPLLLPPKEKDRDALLDVWRKTQ